MSWSGFYRNTMGTLSHNIWEKAFISRMHLYFIPTQTRLDFRHTSFLGLFLCLDDHHYLSRPSPNPILLRHKLKEGKNHVFYISLRIALELSTAAISILHITAASYS